MFEKKGRNFGEADHPHSSSNRMGSQPKGKPKPFLLCPSSKLPQLHELMINLPTDARKNKRRAARSLAVDAVARKPCETKSYLERGRGKGKVAVQALAIAGKNLLSHHLDLVNLLDLGRIRRRRDQ